MPGQLKENRHLQIVQILQDQEKSTIADLSRSIGVSEITIRRDLYDLAGRGVIHRVYGGAVIAKPSLLDPPISGRMYQNESHKEQIGRAAAKLIGDGDSVFIGSGSTTAYVARNLIHRKRLTVVTNALNVGMEFSSSDEVSVVIVGGMLRPSELSLIGFITDQALKEVRVNKVIMGITAISVSAGLSNDHLPEVMTDRAIFAMAPKVILVADHTKFNKVASGFVAPLTRVTTLITDYEADREIVNHVRDLGVEVIMVGGDKDGQ